MVRPSGKPVGQEHRPGGAPGKEAGQKLRGPGLPEHRLEAAEHPISAEVITMPDR